MQTQAQWLFEVPLINQPIKPDFERVRRSRDETAGGVEPIPRHKPRVEDDEPLVDQRIPGDKPKEKGGAVVGNRSFRTSIEARDAARDAARKLGSGHSIIHETPSKPGEQAHYHVVDFRGNRASGHFFYGDRKPRFVDHSKPSRSSKTSRRKTQKEFEITFEALPESNFRVSSTDWKTSSDWLFESPLPSTPAYTQCDFIDPRIDVDAQYALFEMLKGDIPTRTAAISMLSAVRNGSLGGIYKEDQQVPAKRAQRIGKTWWTLIPSGRSAICITQPASEPPIIVFKKSLTNRTLLGTALLTAWSSCGVPIPTPFPPSGIICPNRPQIQTQIKCDPRYQCCGPGCTPPDEIPPKPPSTNGCTPCVMGRRICKKPIVADDGRCEYIAFDTWYCQC